MFVYSSSIAQPPVSSHLNEKKPFHHMVGPHKRPMYGHAARTHAEIRCRVTVLTMSDSRYGNVRLASTRSLRGHSAVSQVLPQRALARKKNRMGAPMRMLDSMARPRRMIGFEKSSQQITAGHGKSQQVRARRCNSMWDNLGRSMPNGRIAHCPLADASVCDT